MIMTPFEKEAIKRENHFLFVATVEATQQIKLLSSECKLQIDHYKALLQQGMSAREERADIRELTVQAMKDSKKCNKIFVELANTLEDRFGINA